MKYLEALDWLYSTQTFGIKLGLDHPRILLEALGNPHRTTDFIHVAGTNGKGSVCAFADSILRKANRKTGLFTSPHLVDFRERIQINGELIPEEAVAEGLTRLREISADCKITPTFFELVTVLALDWFSKMAADAVVLETGMGGRLDATNIVTPGVCILTPVSLDHQQWLGNTLREIATEKAGILKPGVPAVICPQTPEAEEVFLHHARELDAPAHKISSPWTSSPISLRGVHQPWNAAAAAKACELFLPGISNAAIQDGLASAVWPGRFQFVANRYVLDGAHNPSAMHALHDTWVKEFPGEKATIIFGAMQEKDHKELIRILEPLATRFLFVPVRSPRTSSPLGFSSASIPSQTCISLGEGISEAQKLPGKILITGSLFLVGEALSLLRKQPAPIPSRQ